MSLHLEFIKERYNFELERKEKLTAALTLPVGVLTVLGSVLAFMARGFSYRPPFLWFFVAAFGAATVAVVTCLIYLARAYHAQTHVYLPLLEDLDQSAQEYEEFARYVASTGGTIEESFSEELRRHIIRAADANTRSNDLRSRWMHHARIALFFVLLLTALAGVPFVADEIRSKRSDMPTQNEPKPAPIAQTQPPRKPSFPPNRVIREGQDGTTEKR